MSIRNTKTVVKENYITGHISQKSCKEFTSRELQKIRWFIVLISFLKDLMHFSKLGIRNEKKLDYSLLNTSKVQVLVRRYHIFWLSRCTHFNIRLFKVCSERKEKPLRKWVTPVCNQFPSAGLFLYPSKHQKTSGFLMFLGVVELDQWHELG